MGRMDGAFGQAEFVHGHQDHRLWHLVKEVQSAHDAGTRLPARLLNRVKSHGYAMGIGGLVARLPEEELPEGFRFSQQDLQARRAYWVWVKALVVEGAVRSRSRPYIILTMRPPTSK